MGDGRRRIERGEMEKVPTRTDDMRLSFLLIFACLTVSDIV